MWEEEKKKIKKKKKKINERKEGKNYVRGFLKIE